jgi:predicted ester cyclase
MMLDELKARARRIPEELLTQGDLAVADELIDPDCRNYAPQPIATGIDGVKSWVQTLRRAFLDLRAVVEDEIAEGDTVVQRLRLGGTHEGTLFGVRPTGRRVEWQEVEILRVGPNGKFTKRWSCWDRHDLLHQIGAIVITDEHGD